jgi:hypothetical protein
MAKFNTGVSFTDGSTVTGADLNNITSQLNIYTGVISEQIAMSATVSTADQLLIADTDNGDSGAANRVTVQKLLNDTLANGTYTNAQLSGNLNVTQLSTLGTISSTTGTIQTLTSSTANISQGSAIFTQGTIATLNSTTGTIGTLVATGTITGSTNVVNIGSGQIYKDATGNVGIGTNSPLVSAGYTSLTINGTTSGILEIKSNGTQKGVFFNDGSLTRLRSSGTLAFDANNTEAMRIDSSGNVGVGTTPSRKLDVNGVAGATYLMLTSNTASAPTADAAITRPADGTLGLIANSVERLRIDSSGGVTIAGLAGLGSRAVNASATGLLSAASDASLKEEVVGAHIAGLDEILQIHPKMYRWKDDIANRGENASVELGFIANDVAPIIPSAAPLGNDGLYGFYDRSITAALVKAIQELKAENDSLKSRIEALEAK